MKINNPNAFNKRQKNHLPSIPDSSLSVQIPNISTIDSPVEIPTPVSPEAYLSKIIWDTLTPRTKNKTTITL